MEYRAIYKKSKYGQWGVRIEPCDVLLERDQELTVLVTKRSGEQKDEKVKVMWAGENWAGTSYAAVCKIVQPAKLMEANAAL